MDRTLKQIQQFITFDKLLMKDAPEGYKPWYFPVKRDGKDPDPLVIKRLATWETPRSQLMSWKAEHARLNKQKIINLIRQGFNIGIAARKNDPLIIIDIDKEEFLKDMPGGSLITRSRRRTGLHGFFWKGDNNVKQNIPTDQGEMRCSDQYVLCAGSYVPLTDKDIEISIENKELKEETALQIKDDKNRGFYTIEVMLSPRIIKYDELPLFFREKVQQNKKHEEYIKNIKKEDKKFKFIGKKHSALYDLKMSDIVKTRRNARESHPLHPSDTGQNFSISNDGILCHCWRHCVSLNAIQYLCVKSGYAKCEDAGTPHGDNENSKLIGDYGTIFYAWLEAKKMGLLPKRDKIPKKAIWYIAIKNNIWKHDNVIDKIPMSISRNVIKIIRKEVKNGKGITNSI